MRAPKIGCAPCAPDTRRTSRSPSNPRNCWRPSPASPVWSTPAARADPPVGAAGFQPCILDTIRDMLRAPLDRRSFLTFLAALAAAARVRAQSFNPPAWGGPVRDCHFHLRPTLASILEHMDGCGVSHAVILARDPSTE